jgi:hypothetical protein
MRMNKKMIFGVFVITLVTLLITVNAGKPLLRKYGMPYKTYRTKLLP